MIINGVGEKISPFASVVIPIKRTVEADVSKRKQHIKADHAQVDL